MEISNNYSTAKVWNTSNKNVSKPSEKNKQKLTDSLKEKIFDLAKKDEFYSIYWSEYNLVKESGSSELREMPDYLDQDRPFFEVRA